MPASSPTFWPCLHLIQIVYIALDVRSDFFFSYRAYFYFHYFHFHFINFFLLPPIFLIYFLTSLLLEFKQRFFMFCLICTSDTLSLPNYFLLVTCLIKITTLDKLNIESCTDIQRTLSVVFCIFNSFLVWIKFS